jgi:hypothetical protein
MKSIGIKTGIITAAMGLITLAGAATLAHGQGREYRDLQRAQARVQQECRYNRWGRQSNDCLRAQAELQRAQMVYQQRAGYGTPYYRNDRDYRYTTPTTVGQYRIYRNGETYYVDNRGAELLRSAVNRGYQLGYQEGVNDRRYGRGYNYYENNMYRQGLYGYQSYVTQDMYQYYFQQGFQRGYEDGFNNTSRYGYRNGSTFSILGSVLGSILDLATDDR